MTTEGTVTVTEIATGAEGMAPETVVAVAARTDIETRTTGTEAHTVAGIAR